MCQKLKEEKEQLLLQIEGTAVWRAQKANEYPQQREINLNARDALLKLYEYVEKLPWDHSLFKYLRAPWDLMDDDDVKEELLSGELYSERLNTEIRFYGFQNQISPKEFVEEMLEIWKDV